MNSVHTGRALRRAIAVGVTAGLRPSEANLHPVVAEADVALTALCLGERCVGLFSDVAAAVANQASVSELPMEEGAEALPVSVEFQVSVSHTHFLSRAHTLSFSLTHTLSLSHSLSLSLTHTHTQTHRN